MYRKRCRGDRARKAVKRMGASKKGGADRERKPHLARFVRRFILNRHPPMLIRPRPPTPCLQHARRRGAFHVTLSERSESNGSPTCHPERSADRRAVEGSQSLKHEILRCARRSPCLLRMTRKGIPHGKEAQRAPFHVTLSERSESNGSHSFVNAKNFL